MLFVAALFRACVCCVCMHIYAWLWTSVRLFTTLCLSKTIIHAIGVQIPTTCSCIIKNMTHNRHQYDGAHINTHIFGLWSVRLRRANNVWVLAKATVTANRSAHVNTNRHRHDLMLHCMRKRATEPTTRYYECNVCMPMFACASVCAESAMLITVLWQCVHVHSTSDIHVRTQMHAHTCSRKENNKNPESLMTFIT